MPARRPAHARRIDLPAVAAPHDPTPEEIEESNSRRRNAILHGPPMRRLVQALVETGEALEIDTGTHVVTITVAEK